MPIGLIVLGCVMFICVTVVVFKYIDKRDINADWGGSGRFYHKPTKICDASENVEEVDNASTTKTR